MSTHTFFWALDCRPAGYAESLGPARLLTAAALHQLLPSTLRPSPLAPAHTDPTRIDAVQMFDSWDFVQVCWVGTLLPLFWLAIRCGGVSRLHTVARSWPPALADPPLTRRHTLLPSRCPQVDAALQGTDPHAVGVCVKPLSPAGSRDRRPEGSVDATAFEALLKRGKDAQQRQVGVSSGGFGQQQQQKG